MAGVHYNMRTGIKESQQDVKTTDQKDIARHLEPLGDTGQVQMEEQKDTYLSKAVTI